MASAKRKTLKNAPDSLKSPIWEHYGFYDDGTGTLEKQSAICKICMTPLVYRTGTTSNLRKHLDSKHPHVKLNEKQKVSKRKPEVTIDSTSPTPKQKCLSEMFKPKSKTDPYPSTSKRHREISKSIAVFMAKDLRPFSIVDDDGFEQLIKTLDDKYELPSRTYFAEKLIPNLYDEVKQQVRKSLENAVAVSLTTDGWTSRATESYITFTAHVVTQSFELESFVLQTRKIDVSHTSENLSAVINSALIEWELIRDAEKPAITTDNAANIVGAVRLSGLKHVRCLAHVLNLCVQKGLKNVEAVKMLKKIRRIVSFFHRSSTAAARLTAIAIGLDIKPRRLVQDVETRWNSTFDMLDCFVQMKPAVETTLKLKDLKFKDMDSLPTDEDYELASDLLQLLKVFKSSTTALCSERYPTVSLIYNMKTMLLRHLQTVSADTEVVAAMKAEMLKDLGSRYNDEEQYLIECSMMDPRLKTIEFVTEKQKDDAYSVIHSKMTTLALHEGLVAQASVKQEDDEQLPNLPPLPQLLVEDSDTDLDQNNNSPPKKANSEPSVNTSTSSSTGLGELFNVFITRIESPSADKINTELTAYKLEPAVSFDNKNPIQWWGQNSEKYPILSKVACKYLVVQGTSVASERVFSTAGDTVTAQRARLNSDKVDKLIFLKKNLK